MYYIVVIFNEWTFSHVGNRDFYRCMSFKGPSVSEMMSLCRLSYALFFFFFAVL